MKSRFILVVMMFVGTLSVNAHDFVVTHNGQKLYFNILSKAQKTAEVTYPGRISEHLSSKIEGEVIVPATVKHDNVVYTISSVGAKAFSGATKLVGVTLPAGINHIGDFAFEGCTSLTKVIFPGQPVKFGQGAFFDCTSISNISLGSDWKEIELKTFRWSKDLKTITIPAKVEKIHNLKSLSVLEEVIVDTNNRNFSSKNGMLYSKDGKTLYACPRSKAGKVKVVEGVEVINPGALMDCLKITAVDLPSTIKKVSFREFCRMKELSEIILRSNQILLNARSKNVDFFLFQVSNSKVSIIVLKNLLAQYKERICKAEGEYSIIGATKETPYIVKADEIPQAKSLKGVKNFAKYDK